MRFYLVLPLALLAAGCASVTRGIDEMVHFSSNPPEALMRTSGGMSCVTPCVLKISRNENFTATFSKPGFIAETVAVTPMLSGGGAAGMAGNIILGGVVGAGVDVVTGAALDHCPNPVTVTLRREGSKEPRIDPAASCARPQQPTPES